MKFTEGDPNRDFFEQNPHWRYLDSSVKLIKQFKPELVSKIRWAAFMIEDPDSKYHRLPKEKRVQIVNDNYLKEDYQIDYDPERMEVVSDEIQYLFRLYPSETMSKVKSDYYERERSYQLIVRQERDLEGTTGSNLKAKADIQVKISKIYDELRKVREEFEAENEEQRAKTQGKQQPGVLFTK